MRVERTGLLAGTFDTLAFISAFQTVARGSAKLCLRLLRECAHTGLNGLTFKRIDHHIGFALALQTFGDAGKLPKAACATLVSMADGSGLSPSRD
jgi:hypothetical protein